MRIHSVMCLTMVETALFLPLKLYLPQPHSHGYVTPVTLIPPVSGASPRTGPALAPEYVEIGVEEKSAVHPNGWFLTPRRNV